MMGWYGSGMGGAGPFMWLFMGLFWIALIGLIIWLVVKLLPGSQREPAHHTGRGGTAGGVPRADAGPVVRAGGDR